MSDFTLYTPKEIETSTGFYDLSIQVAVGNTHQAKIDIIKYKKMYPKPGFVVRRQIGHINIYRRMEEYSKRMGKL